MMTATPKSNVKLARTEQGTVTTDVDRQDGDHPASPTASKASPRAWWISLCLQPILLFASGILLFCALGVAQRFGILQSSHAGSSASGAAQNSTRYICPMMCTPPQSEPGRCPVCAMELVPAAASGSDDQMHSVELDPVARRLANIHTTAVKAVPSVHQIRAVGRLSYDESKLKSLTAYVDGRIERLFADYTGVTVEQGDRLALIYSPQLYSGQVELLLAKQARERHADRSNTRLSVTGLDLYRSARERLIELGMTPDQIQSIESSGEANSRMQLYAPMRGTVIEKLAVEGEYVRQGQTIYRLADLTSIWLMLELFPEDAVAVRPGQRVDAILQSLPEQSFPGEVAFVDPNVDPKTRTVGVRVTMDNAKGRFLIGDYANATIHVSDPSAEALVVPRAAVLMAGDESVVYVETTPGRFEIRRVTLGPEIDDTLVVTQGLAAGEQVATRGNFLIDSQMQLVGNPSVIDPAKAPAQPHLSTSIKPSNASEILAAFAQLPDDERRAAEAQRICPVTEMPLGSMGVPPKVMVDGRVVFLCCEGCRKPLLKDSKRYLAVLDNASGEPHLAQRETRAAESATDHLPPITTPMLIGASDDLPAMDHPQRFPSEFSVESSSSDFDSVPDLPPHDLPLVPMEDLQ